MNDRIDRRRFARQLATGAGCLTALPVLGTAVPGATVPDVLLPPAPKLPEDPVGPEAGPAEPPPELLLLSYLVRAFPSDRFDETAIQGIYREIRTDVARGQVLAAFPLNNADEPAFVFAPYRGADADAAAN